MGRSAAKVIEARRENRRTGLDGVEQELGRLAALLERGASGRLGSMATEMAAYLRRPGKRVRARLCLAGEALVTGRTSAGGAACAALLETIHAFLLVHDDVMDEADVRRGQGAMHVVLRPDTGAGRERVGEALAIVAGDWLYTLAMRELLRLPVRPERKLRIADLVLEICAQTAEGQALDIVDGLRPLREVRLEEVLETYRLKTARYTFEAPLLSGALLAGASENELEGLRRFSRAAGVAFQLVDDLLGLFGSDAQLGKPAVSDLAEGKKTWPLVRAYRLADEADHRWLEEVVQQRSAGLPELETARRIVRATGTFDEALRLVQSMLSEAREELPEVCGPARSELVQVLESIESAAIALARPVSLAPHALRR